MAGQAQSVTDPAPAGWLVRARQRLVSYGQLVRFSHTVFALPFALSMAVFVSRDFPVTAAQIVFILVALVSARTAAMSFNRLVDRHIDARNPRTCTREIPAGNVSVLGATVFFLVSCAVFCVAAALLGHHCLVLSPLVLLILLGYSLTKRFTSAAHFVLGLALACAPGGVWYALTGTFALLPIWMMCGVLFWVAGFDVLYSLQDYEFDRSQGLFSIPVRVGQHKALIIARAAHLLSLCLFIVFGVSAGLGVVYGMTTVCFGAALLSQHLTISPNALDRIESAFFTRNAWASVIFFLGMLLERLSY